jgi:hypothetical protein
MKLKLFAFIFIIGAMVFVYSQSSENQFAPAEDFPRDALIYVQFADLPAFINLWNDSNLKRNYVQSENFKQFGNRHLALKLIERFTEFNNNLGFPVDAEMLKSVSEKKAALAVYDIGKMEAVFIAPISDAVFSASKIFQNQSNFEEIALEDGTKYYRREIETNRGREKQKFAFANVRGRFVLASNEKLLLQAVSNINGKSTNNRLSDEPDFAKLAAKTFPHTAVVWVNQANLNDDYYFKHYWLMKNGEKLKGFRAGMFDFEMRDEKWIERREFLLAKKIQTSPKVEANQAENLRALLSESIAFYKIQTVENQSNVTAELLRNAFFDRMSEKNKSAQQSFNRHYFNEADFYRSQTESNYSYLSDDFSEEIDEYDEAENGANANRIEEKLEDLPAKIITSANPQIALSATSPQILPAPMFAEFRKVLIFQLRSPNNLNRQNLENAFGESLQKQITIGGANTKLDWETKSENGQTRREFSLPMLGRGIFYTLQNDKLIISNSSVLLAEIAANLSKTTEKNTESETSFDDLTVIRLDKRADAFDGIMQRIIKEKSSDDQAADFFAGNIGSLLDVAAQISQIEIKRNRTTEFLNEEISFVLK